MINNLRFELSFKNIVELDNKLIFFKLNEIKKINIPCKGLIKKHFFDKTFKYINSKYSEFDVVYHYSLYHQYSRNKDNSYFELLEFIKKCNINKKYKILLVSGSTRKKILKFLMF